MALLQERNFVLAPSRSLLTYRLLRSRLLLVESELRVKVDAGSAENNDVWSSERIAISKQSLHFSVCTTDACQISILVISIFSLERCSRNPRTDQSRIRNAAIVGGKENDKMMREKERKEARHTESKRAFSTCVIDRAGIDPALRGAAAVTVYLWRLNDRLRVVDAFPELTLASPRSRADLASQADKTESGRAARTITFPFVRRG